MRTVFFDVDFTLIYPGPTFHADGYQQFARRHGFEVDPQRFGRAITRAAAILDDTPDAIYRPELFVRYASRVLAEMGGRGAGLEPCAREIYDQWAVCHHFALYDDVRKTLARLHADGVTIGLISNTHRCLVSFQQHFELERYVTGAVSSSDHGFLKPHPSIFEAALTLLGASPSESVMVGDSLTHDIEGARQVGMRGVLLARGETGPSPTADIPVIRTLTELPDKLEGTPLQ